MQIVKPENILVEDAHEINWVLVRDAYANRWKQNAKLHDIGSIIQSIEKYGFKDFPKFDKTLNAIQCGNGRIEALWLMERDHYGVPRGIGITQDGLWALPVIFGTDDKDVYSAKLYALDHNNITMTGGDFTPEDIAKLWNRPLMLSVLEEVYDHTDEQGIVFTAEELSMFQYNNAQYQQASSANNSAVTPKDNSTSGNQHHTNSQPTENGFSDAEKNTFGRKLPKTINGEFVRRINLWKRQLEMLS
jgi:hypothetical protein